MNKNLYAYTLCLLILASCGPKVIPVSTAINEDFSVYRKQYSYQPEKYEGNDASIREIQLTFDSTTQQYDITMQLNRLLEAVPLVAEIRLDDELRVEGWRIQIYRGRDQKEASEARQKSYTMFPNLTPYMIYNAPRYQVRVGDFLEPYEYQAFLKAFKREFPGALAIPDIVNVIIDKSDNKPKQNKK
jgi:hypothetical protein